MNLNLIKIILVKGYIQSQLRSCFIGLLYAIGVLHIDSSSQRTHKVILFPPPFPGTYHKRLSKNGSGFIKVGAGRSLVPPLGSDTTEYDYVDQGRASNSW